MLMMHDQKQSKNLAQILGISFGLLQLGPQPAGEEQGQPWSGSAELLPAGTTRGGGWS